MTMFYPKTKEDWLTIRKSYVSSTESSALFGLNKYLTAFELAMLKAGKIEDTFEGNDRTQWGSLLERTIATHYAEEAGVKIRSLNAYVGDAHDPIGASYDFEIIGKERDSDAAALYRTCGPGVLEIKNVDALIYRDEWTKEEAPEHIEIQVQQQLECVEREWAIIAVLIGGNRLESHVRLRDRAVGASIRRRARTFFEELERGVYPAVDLPRDTSVLARLYRHTDGSVIDKSGDSEVRELCLQYQDALEFERRAKEQKEVVKGMLWPLIGSAERVYAAPFTIHAGEIAEAQVPAYTRKGYRSFRITKQAEKARAQKLPSAGNGKERALSGPSGGPGA